MAFLVLLAIVGGLAFRGTSKEDRARYLDITLAHIRQLKVAATERRPEDESFRHELRARTPHVLVTPAIVAVNAAVVGYMLFGASAISDPDTLVAWGANLGPRTTNGEWWRLITSTFVHRGTLHLLVNVAVLIQLGAVLERLLGGLTVTAAYLSAGAFASLVNLSSHPVAVTVGASGAIFGLYGLLLAGLIWQMFHCRFADPQPDADLTAERRVTIPLTAVKRLCLGAAVFIVYSAVNGLAHAAEFTGLVVGLGYGLVLARRASDHRPTRWHVGTAMVATVVVAVACAVPLRHIADVKPEIARLVATEERTASTYQTAFDAFKKGRITPEAFAHLAEHIIMPELQAADTRLQALRNVPPESQPVLNDARGYLRLRSESWRVRADAIRQTNTDLRQPPDRAADAGWRLEAEARYRSNRSAMGKAEGAERAALEAFQRFRRTAAAQQD